MNSIGKAVNEAGEGIGITTPTRIESAKVPGAPEGKYQESERSLANQRHLEMMFFDKQEIQIEQMEEELRIQKLQLREAKARRLAAEKACEAAESETFEASIGGSTPHHVEKETTVFQQEFTPVPTKQYRTPEPYSSKEKLNASQSVDGGLTITGGVRKVSERILRDYEKNLMAIKLKTNDVETCFVWNMELMEYLASGGTESPLTFIGVDRKIEFETYVFEKYGQRVQPEELYSDMDCDRHGKCIFVVDFMASVVDQQKVPSEDFLAYFGMKYRKHFDAAASTDYLMVVNRALSVLPKIENEALAVQQILDGLQPESLQALVKTRCPGIDRATVELAIKQIRGVVSLKQKSANLYKQVGGLESCEKGTVIQSDKANLMKSGIGDKKQTSIGQPAHGAPPDSYCSNCKKEGHTPNFCPIDCQKCTLVPCGKKPKHCPIWVQHQRDRSMGRTSILPLKYIEANTPVPAAATASGRGAASTRSSARAPSPANLSDYSDTSESS